MLGQALVTTTLEIVAHTITELHWYYFTHYQFFDNISVLTILQILITFPPQVSPKLLAELRAGKYFGVQCNDAQRKGLCDFLEHKAALNFFSVFGPPGTGKTNLTVAICKLLHDNSLETDTKSGLYVYLSWTLTIYREYFLQDFVLRTLQCLRKSSRNTLGTSRDREKADAAGFGRVYQWKLLQHSRREMHPGDTFR
jgi:hypothetical protein